MRLLGELWLKPMISKDHIQRERGLILDTLPSLDQPITGEFARIGHTNAFHHRTRTKVMSLGERNHGSHIEFIERKP